MKTANLFAGLAMFGMICLVGCSEPEVAKPNVGGGGGGGGGTAVFNPKGLAVGPEVGKLAPEIEGEDLDGVSFKLSDYRGKVVMLDFYGDW